MNRYCNSCTCDQFRSLDEEEAADKMEEADENMDNMISWEEHLKQTYDYLPEEIEDFDKDDNPEVKSLHDVSIFVGMCTTCM